jgi:ABC-type polysaccharide/polyol phosphate transport system ATPase subunit
MELPISKSYGGTTTSRSRLRGSVKEQIYLSKLDWDFENLSLYLYGNETLGIVERNVDLKLTCMDLILSFLN